MKKIILLGAPRLKNWTHLLKNKHYPQDLISIFDQQSYESTVDYHKDKPSMYLWINYSPYHIFSYKNDQKAGHKTNNFKIFSCNATLCKIERL